MLKAEVNREVPLVRFTSYDLDEKLVLTTFTIQEEVAIKIIKGIANFLPNQVNCIQGLMDLN